MVKVAIIVGHNEKSQGAQMFGITEFEFWSDFFYQNLYYLVEQASKENIELKLFFREHQGRYGYSEEMREVHRRIDAWGGDVSVSCHFNAGGKTAKGHEVLYFSGSTGGKLVAKVFDQAMDKHLNNRDRDRKTVTIGDRGSYGLKVGKAKSIIIEPFFAKELKEFVRDGSQRQLLINSFIDFFYILGEFNIDTDNISKRRNSQLTTAEYESALELLS